jgi:rhodanese-related sulfurtransferase
LYVFSPSAKAHDLAYPAAVKNIVLLLAACVLCLSLTVHLGCKSDSPTATDAAATDEAATRDGAQPDAAAAPINADLAASPADAQRDVSMQDVATTAADGPGKDSPLAGDEGKDSTSDLRAPALDVAAETDTTSSGEVGCSGWTTLKRLSAAELWSLLATSDPIVINVHYPYAGDIPGTDTSIHYDDVDAIEAYLHYDHCADVVLICMSGGMSQSAGNELIKRGYLRVRDLNGGMQAWEAAGYTLLKDGGP